MSEWLPDPDAWYPCRVKVVSLTCDWTITELENGDEVFVSGRKMYGRECYRKVGQELAIRLKPSSRSIRFQATQVVNLAHYFKVAQGAEGE
jgi:hypothetical protein